MFGGLEQMLRLLQSPEEWMQPLVGFEEHGPKAKVYDQGSTVKVVIEAPGLNSSNNGRQWAFRVLDQNLYLRGKLDTEVTGRSDFGAFYSERSSQQFTKIIPLPSQVKRNPSCVHCEDGVITIVFEKQHTVPTEEAWHMLSFPKK